MLVSPLAPSVCLSPPVNCTPQQYHQFALNAVKLPWSIGTAQLVVGTIYVLPLWILRIRDAPRLTMDNAKGLIPIAMCHVLSLVCVTASLGGTLSVGCGGLW